MIEGEGMDWRFKKVKEGVKDDRKGRNGIEDYRSGKMGLNLIEGEGSG